MFLSILPQKNTSCFYKYYNVIDNTYFKAKYEFKCKQDIFPNSRYMFHPDARTVVIESMLRLKMTKQNIELWSLVRSAYVIASLKG